MPRNDSHRSPDFAAAMAANAALRAEIERMKREQKAANEAGEWRDAWAKVEAEEAQIKARQKAALDLTSGGFRTVPCNCQTSSRSFMEKHGAGKCFHCGAHFEDYRLFDAHKQEHHANG